MDLVQRIAVVAAKSTVGTHDLQQNKLLPIIGAKKFFGSQVVLLLKNDYSAAILCLRKEYSDVFTNQDIVDINSHKRKYFIIYKKNITADAMSAITMTLCQQSAAPATEKRIHNRN
jgi:hypothetical protein